MGVIRLHGKDGERIKVNKLSNGYTFATRKDVAYVDGNRKPDAVAVVARDDQGRLLVIREKRPVVGGYLWSIPAGMIDDGETIEQAAIREVKEETGLDLDVSHGMIYRNTFSSPGWTDELVAIVAGTVRGEITDSNLQHQEDIQAFLMDPDDMVRADLGHSETPMSMWLALTLM